MAGRTPRNHGRRREGAIIFVTGTGTEVGKTYVTAALARALGNVHTRKPVQSFDVSDTQTDADVLAAATGEDPNTVCLPHRWLGTPMAPVMAADALGLPSFTIADLAREVRVDGTTFVEGAGGLLSPIAHDGDNRSLIEALEPDNVLLVADAGLGTINLVRLCVEALAEPPVVYLNRFDATNDLHTRNADWLRTRESLEVVTDLEALAAHYRELISRR
jgi:dethiobiotin synthetase